MFNGFIYKNVRDVYVSICTLLLMCRGFTFYSMALCLYRVTLMKLNKILLILYFAFCNHCTQLKWYARMEHLRNEFYGWCQYRCMSVKCVNSESLHDTYTVYRRNCGHCVTNTIWGKWVHRRTCSWSVNIKGRHFMVDEMKTPQMAKRSLI